MDYRPRDRSITYTYTDHLKFCTPLIVSRPLCLLAKYTYGHTCVIIVAHATYLADFALNCMYSEVDDLLPVIEYYKNK